MSEYKIIDLEETVVLENGDEISQIEFIPFNKLKMKQISKLKLPTNGNQFAIAMSIISFTGRRIDGNPLHTSFFENLEGNNIISMIGYAMSGESVDPNE